MNKPSDVLDDANIPEDIMDAAMEALKAARPPYDSADQYDAHLVSVALAIKSERDARDAIWSSAASYGDEAPLLTPESLRFFIADMLDAQSAIALDERTRCAVVVRDFPHFIELSEADAAKHGMLGRQTSRRDLVEAIMNPDKPDAKVT